jgi:mannose-1-phosphate guanylyltransferase
MMTNNNNYCVIMAGGIGSRFWPYSRKDKPKQFLDFFGTGQTLLQQTFDRYSKIVPKENIFIATNIQYEKLVKEQLPELNEDQILLEPTRRNTAPCIAWASIHIKQLNPNANIIVAPADHLILKETEFIEAITKGLEFVAQSPQLLTLGIKPSRPETGYGYIQIAEEKDGIFYKVKTFIEKPQLEFAQVFIESNEFYWNSGIFLWNVNTILKAFETHIPEICETFKSYENDLEALPNISIDYAIMEKAENVYVQLCNFGWADLGTWGALHEASPKDQHKNVIMKGHTLLYECKDNIIAIPKGKLAVLQGLEDYLIADTDNVLLVCRKDDENSIRRYVNDVQVKLGDEFV